jgi:hypothetical protein
MQPVIDAWSSLKSTEEKLRRFSASLDTPNERFLRAQVRSAAAECGKVAKLLEEALK